MLEKLQLPYLPLELFGNLDLEILNLNVTCLINQKLYNDHQMLPPVFLL